MLGIRLLLILVISCNPLSLSAQATAEECATGTVAVAVAGDVFGVLLLAGAPLRAVADIIGDGCPLSAAMRAQGKQAPSAPSRPAPRDPCGNWIPAPNLSPALAAGPVVSTVAVIAAELWRSCSSPGTSVSPPGGGFRDALRRYLATVAGEDLPASHGYFSAVPVRDPVPATGFFISRGTHV